MVRFAWKLRLAFLLGILIMLFSCINSEVAQTVLPTQSAKQTCTPIQDITIAQILSRPYFWQGKTVKLSVFIGGNCLKVKRQGCICVTDGTASLCAKGRLPKGIPTRPWQSITEEIKHRKFWIKGIIKIYSSRQLIGKADNVFGGKPVYGKIEYAPGKYKISLSLRDAKVVYIEVNDSGWLR